MGSFSEDRIQQDCFMYFNNNYKNLRKLLFAVPNGGKRNPIEAKRMRLTGTVSGVSDLILAYKGTCYFLELKTDVGRQDKEQVIFQNQVESQGMGYFLIRSLDEFINIIKSIIDEAELQDNKSIS